MRINNNIMSLNAHRQLGINNNNSAKSIERLSSGLKVNRAGDDAAGLTISEKMRGQIRGLNMASKNSQDAISLIQTAEGALNETEAMLQRMRELAVQSANDTNVSADRLAIQAEVDALISAIDDIAQRTAFNTQTLLDGTTFTDKIFHTGANVGQAMTVSIGDMQSSALDLDDVGTDGVAEQDAANTSISIIDAAIAAVSEQRSALGAIQNRLEYTIKNLDNTAENLQAAESRIRDVDMAKEMTNYTKNNILQQAATAMLAQANQAPQTVLSLLR